ncbi:MAG: 3-(3-hydroxy-phenyl)propionate transporter MhpT [Acidobacteria bacterium]|nr:3-(3-hydroxy-phenyl)propionate transporter MhpT [Acidobacteriota bacterium]
MGIPQSTKELNTYRVLVLCAIVILLEGFDIQAAGVSAPKLTLAFNLMSLGKGMFLGASAVGIFISAVLGGFLADKFGRRPVVISGVTLFGMFSLSTLLANGLGTLIAARFMTGLGLGAAMPAVIAYASDHSPEHMKKRAVGFIYCAIPLGGLLSGVVIQAGIFGAGWQSVYLIGGLAPLVVAPFLFLLWTATFGTLLVMYLLLGWMPSLLVAMGLSQPQAQYVQMLYNVGASMGAAAGGYLLDRKLLYSTPGTAYVALAVFLAILGFLALDFNTALLVAFGVGAMVTVAQATLYAFAPLCYQPSIRNTGVGAAVAAGRLGTIAGPLLAGSLLGAGKTATDVLIVLIPITLASGIMALLVVKMFSKTKQATI